MFPCFFTIAGTRCAMSISLILTPGLAPRSVTAAVGSPPTQKKEANSALPWHPGALKFYKEKGLKMK